MIRKAVLIFPFLALAAPALAEYRLDTGDLVEIRLVDQPEEARQQRVDRNGMIFLPLIGDIDVARATTEELAEKVADAYRSANVYVAPRVSVTLLEGRPYIVTGDVRQPGSYPSQAELSVEEAVALAGGPSLGIGFRARTPEERTRLIETLTAARTDLFVTELAIARRQAEIALVAEIDLAGVDTRGMPPAFVARRVADQRTLLASSNAALARERDSIASQLELLDGEIEAAERLRAQFDLLSARLEEALSSREELEARGLIANAATLDTAQDLAMAISQFSMQEMNAHRARRARVELGERQKALVSERESRLLAEIADLDTARVKLVAHEHATRLLLDGATAGGEGLALSYELRRETDGRTATLAAEASDPVQPGDLLVVRTRLDIDG